MFKLFKLDEYYTYIDAREADETLKKYGSIKAQCIGLSDTEVSAFYFCALKNKQIPLTSEYIEIADKVTIFDKPKDMSERVCICGAKHTSNPSYHLSYCHKYMKGEN